MLNRLRCNGFCRGLKLGKPFSSRHMQVTQGIYFSKTAAHHSLTSRDPSQYAPQGQSDRSLSVGGCRKANVKS